MLSSYSMVFMIFFAFTVTPPVTAIHCFVGNQKCALLQSGYNFCATTLNIVTREISYSGKTGKTDVFDKSPRNLATHDCFIDIEGNPAFSSCYCRGNACNSPITVTEYGHMLFNIRPP